MQAAWSNIKAVARDICERRLLSGGTPPDELPPAVDRYWHCVAAELEAGIINENDNTLRPFDLEQGLEAYRDWRRRQRTGCRRFGAALTVPDGCTPALDRA